MTKTMIYRVVNPNTKYRTRHLAGITDDVVYVVYEEVNYIYIAKNSEGRTLFQVKEQI